MSQLPTLRTVSRLRACLEDRLERVLKRQITIRNELSSSRMQEGSEEDRELRGEAADLHSAEMITRRALGEISRRDTDAEAKVHERTIAIFLKEAEKLHAQTQLQWEKVGDHRNARLYRMQFLDVRLRIEQELGGVTGVPR
jgi:hypothetical protein